MRDWNGIRRLAAVMALMAGLALLPAAPAIAGDAGGEDAATESSAVATVTGWLGGLVESVIEVLEGPVEGEGGPRLDPSG